MDRQAFRNRMQQLKQYREQNPGKGYWDFKSYEEGGEVPPTNKPTIIEPIPSSADAGNNMFYQMSKDIINGIDNRDWYFTQPTEQKAHMNQLREYMFNNGHISRRGQAVSPKMMKKVIEEVSNIDSMREVARASRQFNNINKYTRWFNAIPLLGLGAAAMYNNNQKE